MRIKSLVFRSLLLLGIIGVLSQCKKEESIPADPLANVAGTYTGMVIDDGKSFTGVKATLTTDNVRSKLCVTSVGLSGTTYQLVLTGTACDGYAIAGQRNGYRYASSSVNVDGKSLNMTGSYITKNASGVNPAIYAYFSFTGTR